MNLRSLIAFIAIGLVLGATIAYPLARVSQPTKIVTKTVTKTDTKLINPDLTALQTAQRLGPGYQVTVQPSAANNYTLCLDYAHGRGNTRGDWHLRFCAKVR